VLLLHRTLPAPALITGMDAAMTIGNFDPDLVAVEARRATLTRSLVGPVTLPATAPAAAGIDRPAPSLAGYDRLLATDLQEATA
jgi:hypothetical protein